MINSKGITLLELKLLAGEAPSLPTERVALVCPKLYLDDHVVTNLSIGFHYSNDGLIRFDANLELPFSKFFSGPEKSVMKLDSVAEDIDVAVHRFSTNSNGSPSQLNFAPLVHRIKCGKIEDSTTIDCFVINGPQTYFGSAVELVLKDLYISYTEFPNIRKMLKSGEKPVERNLLSGTLSVQKINGKGISEAEYREAIGTIADFFSFARGSRCGFGHSVGKDQQGQVCFTELGFTRADDIRGEHGWSDLEVVSFYPKIFQLLTEAKNSLDEPVLKPALEFYRVSNSIRSTSAEMAVVASHTALETIVPYILRAYGGWSNNLLKNSTSFNDRLRAAVKIAGITSELLEHSPRLQNKSKEFNGADGAELISIFRNRLVHQGKPFKYDGIDLLEVWSVSQWLCEVFVFYLIGYRDKMMDRRRYSGFRGPAVTVPLR